MIVPSLRVRITKIEHTLVSSPHPTLDQTNLPRVPVIRIFGESSLGHNTCVHIHQAYPYIYINYPGSKDPQAVHKFIRTLRDQLNVAISIHNKYNHHKHSQRYIRQIFFVKGVPFYGFHATYQPFLKILLCDPALVPTVTTFLRNGQIMGTAFSVFESHLSYYLQFMCDFALYGCGWLEIGDAYLRPNIDPDDVPSFDASKFRISSIPKATRSPIEFDVITHQILNRRLLTARPLPPFLPPSLPLSNPTPVSSSDTTSTVPEPLVQSVRELWEDERRRRISLGLEPSPPIASDPFATTRGKGGDWRAESRYRQQLEERIEKEREQDEPLKHEVEPWETLTWTCFESVEMLWAPKYRTLRPPPTEEAEEAKVKKDPKQVLTAKTASLNPFGSFDDDDDQLSPLSSPTLLVSSISQLVSSQGFKDDLRKEIDRGGEDDERRMAEDKEPYNEGIDLEGDLEGDMEPLSPQKPKNTIDPNDVVSSAPPSPSTPRRSLSLLSFPPGNQEQGLSMIRNAQGSLSPSKRRRLNAFSHGGTTLMSPQNKPRSPQKTPGGSRTVDPTLNFTPRAEGLYTLPQSNIPPITPTLLATNFVPTQVDILPPIRDEYNPSTLTQRGILKTNSQMRSVKRRKTSQVIAWNDPIHSPVPTSQSTVRSSFPYPSPISSSLSTYVYALRPPSSSHLLNTLLSHNLPSRIYRDPYYSKKTDFAPRNRTLGGHKPVAVSSGTGISTLAEWIPHGGQADHNPFLEPRTAKIAKPGSGTRLWEFASVPPGSKVVKDWLEAHPGIKGSEGPVRERSVVDPSQVFGPTQATPFVRDTNSSTRSKQTMTVLALEVFATSRNGKLPNPEEDPVHAVFYAFQSTVDTYDRRSSYEMGVISVRPPSGCRIGDLQIDYVEDETGVFNRLVDLVRELDPDVLTGWEIQMDSWGYLSDRAQVLSGVDLGDMISRDLNTTTVLRNNPNWERTHTASFKSAGRHVINIYRVMRSEQSFSSYTFENTVAQLLHRRVPKYTPATLTEWFSATDPTLLARLYTYFAERVATVLDLMEETDVITKTSEFARVFGIEFFSVLSRGSQFKVEAFMFRLAKPESFVLISPSRDDVGKQNAVDCIPLVMEPDSGFYKSPVIVLDFQSLYPSIMIAYNYCYSTCLGRVGTFHGTRKLGFSELELPSGILEHMKDHVNIAPNGIIYAKKHVRESLLAKMLRELLDTRVMVKQAMKSAKGDKSLMKILDARQLSLKFIANVTYGYTSATFSGRMPCVEIADSIVESGRETLEKAINWIEAQSRWRAKVVYGDTDSIFVALPGSTKDEAFRIGQTIADEVTAMNPHPVKLKFEKVFHPCVLQSKKRYVGFKYEDPDQTTPVFDAKGIETVRRDGVPAVAKMLETSIKILFRSQDLSEVKDYCVEMWTKMLAGRVSVQDFTFAKEVKLGTYSETAVPGPGVKVAAARVMADRRDETYGDRVPYVIVRGPEARIVDRAHPLEDMFSIDDSKPSLHLDFPYYIQRVIIPPLKRVFDLVGVDAMQWYRDMPKISRATDGSKPFGQPPTSPTKAIKGPLVTSGSATTHSIGAYFPSINCVNCGKVTNGALCSACLGSLPMTMLSLLTRVRDAEARLVDTQLICVSCTASAPGESVRCESLDCSWFYERHKAARELNKVRGALAKAGL